MAFNLKLDLPMFHGKFDRVYKKKLVIETGDTTMLKHEAFKKFKTYLGSFIDRVFNVLKK